MISDHCRAFEVATDAIVQPQIPTSTTPPWATILLPCSVTPTYSDRAAWARNDRVIAVRLNRPAADRTAGQTGVGSMPRGVFGVIGHASCNAIYTPIGRY